MIRMPILSALFGGAALLCMTHAVSALDVEVRAPGTDEALAEALRNASLLVQTARQEDTVPPIEILAAAQADYARLIAVLYEAGRFGPVITVQLDGQEAAAIPPIAAPPDIQRAVITVTPGPAFALGRARITPLARRTERPEGFATGQPASLSVLREGVAAGIEGWRQIGHAKVSVADQQITARHPARAVDVDIRLDPGHIPS